MQWNNAIQKAIIEEWTEGCQKIKDHPARPGLTRLGLRRRIAKKYSLSSYLIRGIVDLGASQGLSQDSGDYGKRYEPINYHELVGDLKERIAGLELKYNYVLEGIDKVVEDGETMRIHMHQLRGIVKWARKRETLSLEDRPTAISDRR